MRYKLRDKRLQNKLSQKEVAKILNIPERSYSFIECGVRQGSIRVWDMLEDLFETPQRELRENIPKNTNKE